MFDNLNEKLERAIKVLKGQGRITEMNVSDTVKEIRKALLDADVNYKVAKTFTENVKAKALGANVLTAVSPGQLLTKITHDELTLLMGEESKDIKLTGNPTVILMSGLQGSGKTTFSGKLASHLKNKRGKNPLLVACDIYRPAAIDQLHVLGAQLGVEVYSDKENKDAVSIAKKAIQQAKSNGNTVVIIDTAGRLAVDEKMMNEIAEIKKAINPDEILFVVDSMTGQDAVNTAKAFNDRLDFTGVVLTKLDGDTRGGAALSILSIVNKPIKFIGTGEKLDAMDVFHPSRMADRILGMGDVVSLVEKAQEHYNEEEEKKLFKKISKNQFDLDDYLSQIKKIKKMGGIKDMMGMLPGGLGKEMRNAKIEDDVFKSTEAIISSMTPAERANPDLLNGKRRERIAKGSGNTVIEVNKTIKQFEEMKKMMKMMGNKEKMGQMMARMKNMNMPGMK
jgi:signal recognition particle subunit SRP54